jgi:glutathione S-transferase
MKLYIDRFWISPYSFSAFVALTEKQVAFEIKEVALDRDEQKSDQYVQISTTGRVPTLVCEDLHLAESSAIAEFLEEMYSGLAPLLPRELKQRAQARMLMAWLRSDFAALRAERPTHTMFFAKASQPLSAKALLEVTKLTTFCQQFSHFKRGQLFDEWTLVDAELAFMLHRLILNDESIEGEARAYAEKNWQRDSVQKFVNHKRAAYSPY